MYVCNSSSKLIIFSLISLNFLLIHRVNNWWIGRIIDLQQILKQPTTMIIIMIVWLFQLFLHDWLFIKEMLIMNWHLTDRELKVKKWHLKLMQCKLKLIYFWKKMKIQKLVLLNGKINLNRWRMRKDHCF